MCVCVHVQCTRTVKILGSFAIFCLSLWTGTCTNTVCRVGPFNNRPRKRGASRTVLGFAFPVARFRLRSCARDSVPAMARSYACLRLPTGSAISSCIPVLSFPEPVICEQVQQQRYKIWQLFDALSTLCVFSINLRGHFLRTHHVYYIKKIRKIAGQTLVHICKIIG